MNRAADAFLRAFHAAHPGATSQALAGCRTDSGRSSYELLAELVPAGGELLDLGCGDGHLLTLLRDAGHPAARLAGLDLSGDELRAARARPALAAVPLVQARAQALPLPAASRDIVLSHLAFTLMDELPRVVAELARVLRPGGEFAAIVGGGPRLGDSFERFADLVGAHLRGHPAAPPRLGEPCGRSDAGLHALFGPASGFTGLAVADLTLRLDAPAGTVWTRLAASYELFPLDAAERSALRRAFLAGSAALVRPDGTLPCAMFLRLVRARRLP